MLLHKDREEFITALLPTSIIAMIRLRFSELKFQRRSATRDFLGEQFPIENKMSAEIHDLAYVEVMKFDKANEEREHTNDHSTLERQHKRQQTRKHSYLDR